MTDGKKPEPIVDGELDAAQGGSNLGAANLRGRRGDNYANLEVSHAKAPTNPGKAGGKTIWVELEET